jgi:hypothetical protein
MRKARKIALRSRTDRSAPQPVAGLARRATLAAAAAGHRPGGVAEMSLTAMTLGLEAALAVAAEAPTPAEIDAFCARHGLSALTPEQRSRMAELARIVAKAGAALPRIGDKFEEPATVFRVRG